REGRDDQRHPALAVAPDLALGEVERGHREDAAAVVEVGGLEGAGEDPPRVWGRELEEPPDRVSVAVTGQRHIPSSRSTPAMICTASSRSCSLWAAETEM